MAENNSASLTEIGVSGLHHFGGMVNEEFLKDLRGQKGLKVYREMSENDPIVGACVRAIETIVKRSEWTVRASSDSNEDKRAAQFVEECMGDMNKSFGQTVSQALSMVRYGFSMFEILYKKRIGNPFAEDMGSTYNDGKIGWREFSSRSQDSVFDWDFDDYGRIKGFNQMAPPKYEKSYIPAWKLLHFKTSHYKDNPEGISVLRNAYRPYFFKKRLEEVEAIGVERDLNGIPTAWVPTKLLAKDASTEEKETLAAIQGMIRNTKQDREAGLILPLAYDHSGNKIYDFELMSSKGRRTHNTSGIIMRYNRDIAASMLADFILIGHENVGSFALASAKTHLFSVAIGSYLDEIKDVMNKRAIPRLLRLNGMTNVKPPTLEYSDIETVELDDLAQYVKALSTDAGIDLTGDDVQDHLKHQAGIPKGQNAVMEDDEEEGEDESNNDEE